MGSTAPLFAIPYSQFARFDDGKLKAYLLGKSWPGGQKPTTIARSIEILLTRGPACCENS